MSLLEPLEPRLLLSHSWLTVNASPHDLDLHYENTEWHVPETPNVPTKVDLGRSDFELVVWPRSTPFTFIILVDQQLHPPQPTPSPTLSLPEAPTSPIAPADSSTVILEPPVVPRPAPAPIPVAPEPAPVVPGTDLYPGNPSDSWGWSVKPGATLYGADGLVSQRDFVQGSTADCWWIASLAAEPSIAYSMVKPDATTPGWFVVSFIKSGKVIRVHTSSELPGWFTPTTDGAIVGGILEKAFCAVRTGANTYDSLSFGNGVEAGRYFGQTWTDTYTLYLAGDTVWNLVNLKLAQSKPVTTITPSTTNLVVAHVYTVVSTATVGGVHTVTLRNPWGFDGPLGDSVNDGYLTIPFSEMLLNVSWIEAQS